MSHKKSKRLSAPKSVSRPVPAAAPATPAVLQAAALPEPTASASPAAVIAALQTALDAVRSLSARRLEAKLSVARLMSVTRELKELLKVMSVYGA